MPGMTHDPDKTQHAVREMPCAFSGLTTAGLAAADPVLLALAIAFVVATVFRVAPPVVARAPEFLRPPCEVPRSAAERLPARRPEQGRAAR
ncbi:hypothetical protein QP175_05240 [Sphingomonas aerolata]|uniref:hypothetical protein n=1 Tax=Sphingomonas aerolata TaxID=185951 RepID=UPI002FE33BBD